MEVERNKLALHRYRYKIVIWMLYVIFFKRRKHPKGVFYLGIVLMGVKDYLGLLHHIVFNVLPF